MANSAFRLRLLDRRVNGLPTILQWELSGSNSLEDDNTVRGNDGLQAARLRCERGAIVSDVVSVVDRSVAVEDFTPLRAGPDVGIVDDIARVVEGCVVERGQHNEFLCLIPAAIDQNAIGIVDMQDFNVVRPKRGLIAAQENRVAPELE